MRQKNVKDPQLGALHKLEQVLLTKKKKQHHKKKKKEGKPHNHEIRARMDQVSKNKEKKGEVRRKGEKKPE